MAGSLMGHIAHNGKPSRQWAGRKQTTSPTPKTESSFPTAMIDACEARDVMSADGPSAFAQTQSDAEDGDEHIDFTIAGASVDAILNNNPHLHGGFAVHENVRKEPCVKVPRSSHDMALSTSSSSGEILTRKILPATLVTHVQPTGLSQDTNKKTRLHVNDVMSSHTEAKVNNDFEEWQNNTQGEHGEVKHARGDKHDHLGITFKCDLIKSEVLVMFVICLFTLFFGCVATPFCDQQ